MLALFPLVASIYAISNGIGTLAGEEEDGRLEMIVTLPLPRWKIVTAKALAHGISSFIIILFVAFVTWGVFIAIEGQIDTVIGGLELFKAVLSTWLFVFAVGMLSMFLAAFCSSRRIASVIATVVLIIGYFGSNLAASTKLLEPFEPLFLSTYIDGSGQAVINGQASGDMLVLLGIGLGFLRPGFGLLPEAQADGRSLALAGRQGGRFAIIEFQLGNNKDPEGLL